MHRLLAGTHVVWAGAEHGNVFNGVNAGRAFAEPTRAFPTTYVYHHRNLAASHKHASKRHTPPRPSLQCTRPPRGGHGAPMASWVQRLARSWTDYATARKGNVTYCMLVDLT